MSARGYVAEVFRSFQGEGIYAGVLQVFLRMAGCSRGCGYCDTGWARVRLDRFSVSGTPKSLNEPNPVTVERLIEIVRRSSTEAEGIRIPGLHSLSITGGEPLEQIDFLEELLRSYRPGALPIYLETNGLFEDAVRRIATLVDIVAMDVKLPSLCGVREAFDVYDRVIPLFRGKGLFVKVALPSSYDAAEYDRAVALVARHDRRIPFVIQPIEPLQWRAPSPGVSPFAAPFARAARELEDIRVIPQMHKVLGVE